jgi:hypothetical protein
MAALHDPQICALSDESLSFCIWPVVSPVGRISHMIDSRTLIKNDCDARQWAEFERTIEMLNFDCLDAINNRLGGSVPTGSPWRSYADAFSYYTWRDLTMAYEYATDKPYPG